MKNFKGTRHANTNKTSSGVQIPSLMIVVLPPCKAPFHLPEHWLADLVFLMCSETKLHLFLEVKYKLTPSRNKVSYTKIRHNYVAMKKLTSEEVQYRLFSELSSLSFPNSCFLFFVSFSWLILPSRTL